MQPEENQVDPEQGSPAEGGPDNLSLPLPIVLRVPWFPQEPSATAVAALSPDAIPPEQASEMPSTHSPVWCEPERPRRRWPVLAALAGCLCAVAVGAVVDEFWWSRPDADRPQVRRAVNHHITSPTTAPTAEIEPLLAAPSASRPETSSAVSVSVRPVTLAPEIIPIESGDEP